MYVESYDVNVDAYYIYSDSQFGKTLGIIRRVNGLWMARLFIESHSHVADSFESAVATIEMHYHIHY